MNFIRKFFNLFKKTKETVANVELKVQAFIKKNKKQIQLAMTLLEAIFPEGAGIKKMSCLITTVCYAIGLEKITPDIADFVAAELQKLYDKFKDELKKD